MSDFLDSTQWCSKRYPVEKILRRVKNSDVSYLLLRCEYINNGIKFDFVTNSYVHHTLEVKLHVIFRVVHYHLTHVN